MQSDSQTKGKGKKQKGPVLNPEDKDLVRRVKEALIKKDITAFRRLLKGGVDVNGKSWFESSLLHEATQMGNVQFVDMLLKANADVNASNKNGRTPLHIAARAGNTDIVTTLLKNGANVNGKVEHLPGSVCNTSAAGQSPLHVALWRGRVEVVNILLESGADVNALDQDGWMAIQWAATLNYIDILKELIRRGTFIDTPTTNTKTTPLVRALMYKNYDIVKLLVIHGADVNARFEKRSVLEILDKEGETPENEKAEIVKLFIECGLNRRTFKEIKVKLKIEDFKPDIESSKFLKDFDLGPLSLSSLCRTRIRNQIVKFSTGKSIYSGLRKLPLPNVIIDFLTFSDQFPDFYT